MEKARLEEGFPDIGIAPNSLRQFQDNFKARAARTRSCDWYKIIGEKEREGERNSNRQ